MTSAERTTDEELLAAVVRGDLEAFEEIVTRHQKPLVNFLYRLVGDFARAEELCQEAFLRVFRKASSFSNEYRFTTWMYTIARNLARNELRYRSRHPAEASNEAVDGPVPVASVVAGARLPTAPDEQASRNELRGALRAALDQLPEQQRVALVLSEYEQWSYEEIGRMLGRPRGTIKSWIYRGKRTLIKELKDREVIE